jgi:hypothetical protein
MRIEGYPLPAYPVTPSATRPAAQTVGDGTNPPAKFELADETAVLTPQEKLRQALDERRWVAEAAFGEATPEGELGKHIDLRV